MSRGFAALLAVDEVVAKCPGAVLSIEAAEEPSATTLDLNLEKAEILVTASTDEDAAAVRDAVRSASQEVAAREVVVTLGGVAISQDSYGGLALSTCTAGFSVRRTTDNAEGVSTAGHCQNPQTLQKHNTALDYVTGKQGDSQDLQWHKTPGLTDPAFFDPRDGSGFIRNVFSRTDRSQISLGGNVCHSGIASGGGCGEIAGKSFDPDGGGSAYNDTFIRVKNDTTLGGDSGGPWFLGNSAYGTHVGITNDGNAHPVFMAQNYMAALNLVVKIN